MSATDGYLVDTSVLARAPQTIVGQRLLALVEDGNLWTCQIVDLEVIYASRARDVQRVIAERQSLPEAEITPATMSRAVIVAGLMAEAGHHRGAKPVALIIAAAAELSGLTVLHYDSDYDRVSEITRQRTEWVAPAGSLEW